MCCYMLSPCLHSTPFIAGLVCVIVYKILVPELNAHLVNSPTAAPCISSQGVEQQITGFAALRAGLRCKVQLSVLAVNRGFTQKVLLSLSKVSFCRMHTLVAGDPACPAAGV